MHLCFSTSDFRVDSSDRCDAHTLWMIERECECERGRVKVRKREAESEMGSMRGCEFVGG